MLEGFVALLALRFPHLQVHGLIVLDQLGLLRKGRAALGAHVVPDLETEKEEEEFEIQFVQGGSKTHTEKRTNQGVHSVRLLMNFRSDSTG